MIVNQIAKKIALLNPIWFYLLLLIFYLPAFAFPNFLDSIDSLALKLTILLFYDILGLVATTWMLSIYLAIKIIANYEIRTFFKIELIYLFCFSFVGALVSAQVALTTILGVDLGLSNYLKYYLPAQMWGSVLMVIVLISVCWQTGIIVSDNDSNFTPTLRQKLWSFLKMFFLMFSIYWIHKELSKKAKITKT